MIDLRKEISQIIIDYGWPVLLQRTHRQMRCRCYNSVKQEADPKCPFCLGKGWISSMERRTLWGENATQVVQDPNLQQMTQQGKMYVPAMVFYCEHDMQPQIGDMIYEVGWKGLTPTNLIAAWEINNVAPYRGDRGRIEYYEAAAKTITLDREFLHFSIRRIGRNVNYEMC